jgi:hypothetical protein
MFIHQMLPQNAENGHFSKVTYVPEGFLETNKYSTTQPLDQRKKGFGTKDAHRRDEFCNDIRTEQYRETLRKEKELTAEKPEMVKERLTRLLAERAHRDLTLGMTNSGTLRNEKVYQYDVGRSRTTPFDPKSTKDTYYKYDTDKGFHFGETSKPTSTTVGETAWTDTYRPPQYGGKSEVKNFFDKSHLNVRSY